MHKKIIILLGNCTYLVITQTNYFLCCELGLEGSNKLLIVMKLRSGLVNY